MNSRSSASIHLHFVKAEITDPASKQELALIDGLQIMVTPADDPSQVIGVSDQAEVFRNLKNEVQSLEWSHVFHIPAGTQKVDIKLVQPRFRRTVDSASSSAVRPKSDSYTPVSTCQQLDILACQALNQQATKGQLEMLGEESQKVIGTLHYQVSFRQSRLEDSDKSRKASAASRLNMSADMVDDFFNIDKMVE